MNYEQLHIPTIKYQKPIKDDGYFLARAKCTTGENLVIRSPIFKCVSAIKNHKCGGRWELEFELKKKDKPFYHVISEIEDYDITVVHANSAEWFGQHFPIETVEEYQKPFIRIRNKQLKMRLIVNETVEGISKECVNRHYVLMMRYTGLQFMKQTFTQMWVIDKLEYRSYNDFDKFDFNNSGGMTMFDTLENQPNVKEEEKVEEVNEVEERVEEVKKIDEEKVEEVEEKVKEVENVVVEEMNKEEGVGEVKKEIVVEKKAKRKKFKTLRGIR